MRQRLGVCSWMLLHIGFIIVVLYNETGVSSMTTRPSLRRCAALNTRRRSLSLTISLASGLSKG
jgi:hypothetical protein